MIADDFLPTWDVRSQHQTLISADPAAVYHELTRVDMGQSPVIRILFSLRGLSRDGLSFEGLTRIGFAPLANEPPRRILLGLIGKFWSVRGGIRDVRPADFASFMEPGYARAVWGFDIEPVSPGHTRLTTETRVHCTDATSRRRFKRYWRLVGPFSGWTRREILRLVRGACECRGSAA